MPSENCFLKYMTRNIYDISLRNVPLVYPHGNISIMETSNFITVFTVMRQPTNIINLFKVGFIHCYRLVAYHLLVGIFSWR